MSERDKRKLIGTCMACSLCGDGNYLLMGDTMKQVTNPPKTGEVFIVVLKSV